MNQTKIFLLVSLLSLLLCIDSIAQTHQVAREAFQAEINKAISAYPHGVMLYQESDNFQRLIYAEVANKLGPPDAASVGSENLKNNEEPLSIVSDLTPDNEDEDETSIAISRSDPNLIVAGSNDLPGMLTGSMPVYVSADAGQNWKTYWLPIVSTAQVQALGDPVLICDDKGLFYYSFLISLQLENRYGSGFVSDLMVARSTDGINWTLGSTVLNDSIPSYTSEDKETIAVDRDPASPYYGRLYIAWTHFLDNVSDSAQRFIAHSDDHGVTWSAPDTIPTAYGYFALLRTGRNGDVFIGSSHRDDSTFAGSYHAMMVSHDGGKTFTQTIVSPYVNYPRGDYPNELKDSVKAFPYLSFDVDPSNNNIFAVYGSYIGISESRYAAEYAVTSTDEGASWSAPQQIGTPGQLATDHFQPWVTFDPTNGKARISMYSSEEDPGNNLLTRLVLFDFDSPTIPYDVGADLFDPNEVAGDGRTDPFIGDYTGGDAYAGTFAIAWTEKNPDGPDGDIFAYVESPAGSVSMTKINESNLILQGPSSNPATGNTISFAATSNVSSAACLTLFDINGRGTVSTEFELTPDVSTSISLDVQAIPAGVYRAVLESEGHKDEKNVVILR